MIDRMIIAYIYKLFRYLCGEDDESDTTTRNDEEEY